MHLHLCLRNMPPSAVLHSYVATKMDRLESLAAEILAVYIVILRHEGAADGGAYSVKALAVVSGPEIYVHCAGDEPRYAIDRVCATLSARFRKRKIFLRKRRLPAPSSEGAR